MKFSGNGLYIEKYVKCVNCGVIIYETDLPKSVDVGDGKVYCGQWCVNWAESRAERKSKKSA